MTRKYICQTKPFQPGAGRVRRFVFTHLSSPACPLHSYEIPEPSPTRLHDNTTSLNSRSQRYLATYHPHVSAPTDVESQSAKGSDCRVIFFFFSAARQCVVCARNLPEKCSRELYSLFMFFIHTFCFTLGLRAVL